MKGADDLMKRLLVRTVSTDLKRWLRAPDATIDLKTNSSKRHAGTGHWLIHDSIFDNWLQQANSFLWLYGFAGCGRSVLCSIAIRHVFHNLQSSPTNSAAPFFSFTFNDKSKQDASAALRALLLQLYGQASDLDMDLICLKYFFKYGTRPVSTLLRYLRQAVTRYRHVYLLLDTLKESPIDRSRLEILSMIKTIRRWREPGLYLLVTSRDFQYIRDYLQSGDVMAHGEQIALNNDSVHQDISQYVAHRVDHGPKLSHWGDDREKIKKQLIDNAEGVFRWVECQLNPLRQCARRQRVLEKCLLLLPRDRDQTYEHMLCQIKGESREEAQQLLSLLCHAVRPLTVEEVIEATAVDLDDLKGHDAERRFHSADDLLRICTGLIEIRSISRLDDDGELDCDNDTSLEKFPSQAQPQFVHIAHFSLQKYSLSDRIRSSRAAVFALSGPIQQAWITKACLVYPSHNGLVEQISTEDLAKEDAFSGYAARYWHHQNRQAHSQYIELLSEKIEVFLTTGDTRQEWIMFYDPDQERAIEVKREKLANCPFSRIYYASLLGLDRALGMLLSKSTNDVNMQQWWYGNALSAASSQGHEVVVQILLDKGAEVNAQGGE